MKTLRLKTSIGTADNRTLQLPEVAEGSIVEVADEAAAHMLRRGWAEVVDDGDGLAESHDEPGTADDDGESAATLDLKAVPPVEIRAEDGPGADDESIPAAELVEDDEPGTGDEAGDSDDDSGPSPRRRRGRPKKDQG